MGGVSGQWVPGGELACRLEWGAYVQSRVVPQPSLDRGLGQSRQGVLTSFAWAKVARTVLPFPPKVVLGTGAH